MTSLLYKPLLSACAIALTLIAFFPYIRAIVAEAVRPHVFSWMVWGMTTAVVFFAQIEAGGGVGAIPVGVSGGITISIAVLAYLKRSEISITRTDWLFFLSAIASIPLWYATSDPFWAVVVLTIIDVLGFGPTVRKAYAFPHSESLLFFALFTLRNLIVIMALERYSVTTVLFPAAIAACCVLLMFMIVWRRRIQAPDQSEIV